MKAKFNLEKGFTLIELSIVLVIIGLIIGGVLVGKDLIMLATVRAQLTQIEKYNTAVNIFRGKYNGQIPGDIDSQNASIFGFAARGTSPGQGDGNGLLQGSNGGIAYSGLLEGEPATFWVDLSTAGLIENKFTLATPTYNTCWLSPSSVNPGYKDFLPPAKIGNGDYIYVGAAPGQGNTNRPYGADVNSNYFVISNLTSLWTWCYMYGSQPSVTVAQASYIDAKIDDANPLQGRVLAMDYGYANPYWSTPSWDSNLSGINGNQPPNPLAPSAATCFDNNNTQRQQMHYSMSENSGAGLNCSMAIKFQ